MKRSKLLRAAIAFAAVLFIYASNCEPARGAFTEQGAAILGGANYSSRSASLADYDNDGDLDLMFETSVDVQLFRNNVISTGTPSFTYTNVSATILPSSAANRPGASWSAAWGDYNG